MRRRQFIAGLGAAAASSVSWPLAALARQPAMPVIGYLSARSPGGDTRPMVAFRQGLAESGYVEGQSVRIEYRWADGLRDRLPALAADLVSRQAEVIAAVNGAVVAQAAKAATATIPIVFTNGRDPVGDGLVASPNRPDGNATGINTDAFELVAKRLEILRDLLPQAAAIGVLMNPRTLTPEKFKTFMQAMVQNLYLPIMVFSASTPSELDAAFARAARQRVDSLLVLPDATFRRWSDRIVALAASYQIPAGYPTREFSEVGGLMSYGHDRVDAYCQAGIYVGRILDGEKPRDLPVLQPTKFEFVINLKTAAGLGLTVPPTLLADADEVIE